MAQYFHLYLGIAYFHTTAFSLATFLFWSLYGKVRFAALLTSIFFCPLNKLLSK